MRLALLTYSTRPRGGVVHTLALAEALVELAGEQAVVTSARHTATAPSSPASWSLDVMPRWCQSGPTVGPDSRCGRVLGAVTGAR